MNRKLFWQRLRGSYWLSFITSLLLSAPFGWLVIYSLMFIVRGRLMHNEDREALIYLLGIPLFVGLSFLIIAQLCQRLYIHPIAKQSLARSILITPILFYTLERGNLLLILAPGYVSLSDSGWAGLIALLWTLTMIVGGMLLIAMTPRSTKTNSISL